MQPRTSRRKLRRILLLQGLPGLALLLVLGACAVLALTNPAAFSRPGPGNILNGEGSRAYQKAFEEGLAVRGPALAAWGLARYRLFAEGSRGVLVGRDGWLFTAEEFQTRAAAALRIDLEAVRKTRDELAARGVRLVIALVPAKARVYPEQLDRYPLPRELSGRYRELLARLADLGIPAPDLLGSLLEGKKNGQVFLRTDTHWTPYGAEVAAAALAKAVAGLLAEAGSPRARFLTAEGPRQEYRGDLFNFIPLGPWEKRFGPRPDSVLQSVTSAEDPPATGLFDRIAIPVVLVGSSYSAGALWNLEGALKTALEADVLNVSKQGQGSLAPMRTLLQGSALEDVQADVLVWEIPERYFTLEAARDPGRGNESEYRRP